MVKTMRDHLEQMTPPHEQRRSDRRLRWRRKFRSGAAGRLVEGALSLLGQI